MAGIFKYIIFKEKCYILIQNFLKFCDIIMYLSTPLVSSIIVAIWR